MARYFHQPDNPLANERGMVDEEAYAMYNYLHSGDSKRAIIGNQEVCINFISDTMPDTRHMSNGRYYDSKSKFRQVTKQHGCIEVGNEESFMMRPRAPKKLDKRQRREDIKKALWEVRNGRDIKTEVMNAVKSSE